MSFQFMNSASSWTTGRGGFSLEEERAARDEGRTAGPAGSIHTAILNDTGLPDHLVEQAVMDYMTDTYFVENASLAGAQSTFQTYVNDGSLLAKHRYRTPTNVIEEMRLARDLAERDDDIRAVIGGAIALAFQHVQHHSRDRRSTELAEKLGSAKHMNLRHVLSEMMREYYVTSSVTTVKFLTPTTVMMPSKGDADDFESTPTLLPVRMLYPQVGVLPGENIRVIGSDLFGDKALAYWPGDDMKLTKFLEEYFSDQTSPARRRQMQLEDPVSTALFIAPVQIEDQQTFIPGTAYKAYLMNPAMVHRTSMPKGFWPYARPLLASVFPLLEAKRLLNIMDYALLQGAANYVVVAKKGSDLKPALPNEIVALREEIRHLGRSGAMVGDHRLSFEILTPTLTDMLSTDRRELIGRRIVSAIFRKPITLQQDAGAEGAATEAEWISRVIENDRQDLIDHIEADVYSVMVMANPTEFKAHPKIWCPKIILQGTQFFTDLILKLRDRGDIPRRYAVQAAGINFEGAITERQWEKDAGIDDILTPAPVPYTVPDGGIKDPNAGPEPHGKGPQDNNTGRPTGSRTGQGQDNARPKRTVARNAGETVKAWKDDDASRMYRMGETTRALLATYADSAEEGRFTSHERAGLNGEDSGPVFIVRVNPGYDDIGELKVVRLHKAGASVILGKRPNGGVVARALVFRSPDYDELSAQETAMDWGFEITTDEENA